MASLRVKKYGDASVPWTILPEPSSLTWSLERVSKANAGRTQDGIMHVEQISLKRKLEVQWNAVSAATATTIVQVCQHEYLAVEYYDYLTGSLQTKKFYTGEMSLPVYTFQSNKKLLSNVAFNFIEV